MYYHGTVAHIGAGIHILGKINGVEAEMLIDTGATISIISQGLISSMSECSRPEVIPTNIQVFLANNAQLKVYGHATVEMQLGGRVTQHKIMVADIHNDVLLGLDFMDRRDCIIDIAGKSLRMGDLELPLRKTSEREQ